MRLALFVSLALASGITSVASACEWRSEYLAQLDASRAKYVSDVKDANQTYANSNVRSIYLADRDLNAIPQGVLGNVSGRRYSRAVLVYDDRVKDSWEQWTNSVNGAAVNYSNQTKADYDNYLATACLFWN